MTKVLLEVQEAVRKQEAERNLEVIVDDNVTKLITINRQLSIFHRFWFNFRKLFLTIANVTTVNYQSYLPLHSAILAPFWFKIK